MFLKLSGNPVSKKVSPSESTIDILAKISPHKLNFWKDRDLKSLIIDAKYIFWPLKIKDNLLESVFSDFGDVMDELYRRFDSIEIVTDAKTYKSGENISFRSGYSSLKGSAVVLTVFEVKLLYSCLKQGVFEDVCSLAVKIEDEEHFITNFPRNITLFELAGIIGERLSRSVENLKPVDPITGNILQLEMKLDGSLSSIFFRSTDARYDTPFPLWSMKTSESVKLKEVSGPANLEIPCCNCLACTSVCPSGIAPNILYHLVINEETEEIDNYDISACIRCGRCSIVCPSNIPLFTGIDEYLRKMEKEEEERDEDS